MPPATETMADENNGSGREHDKHGHFKAEYADEEFLEAVAANEPAATSEVADEVGIARQSADYRLRKLEDSGRVSKKKVGNALVWMVADE